MIFVVLYALSRRVPPRPQGTFLGTFLALYGCFRFLIEFVRMPDSQLGYLLGTDWLTMGQCLSIPLAILGVALVAWAHKLGRPQVGHLDPGEGLAPAGAESAEGASPSPMRASCLLAHGGSTAPSVRHRALSRLPAARRFPCC